jgi:hypothetical protein
MFWEVGQFHTNKYLIMILPALHGNLCQEDFFIFAAADTTYFDQYGRTLINSVRKNTGYGVHMHIYNPTQAQLDFCNNTDHVSVTWESVDHQSLNSAIKLWASPTLGEPKLSRRNKMLGTKVVDKRLSIEQNVQQWLFKTYYACMRFVRLAEITNESSKFLAIDVDGLVRHNFVYEFEDQRDFYLHEKEKGGHLAGALLLNGGGAGRTFLLHLADVIRTEIEQDNIYWFLDQWALDQIVDQYNKGYLPIGYIDWYMAASSAIWSAKGKRKHLAAFVDEQKKYQQ